MRPLATVVILALAAAPAAAAGGLALAQWGGAGDQAGGDAAGAGAQGGGLGIGPTPKPQTPTPMPQTRPPGAAALDRDTGSDTRWGPPREKPEDKPDRPPFPDDRDPFRDRPLLFLDDDDFDDDDDRVIVVPAEPAEPPEPDAAPAAPPAPPDPRGPKFVPARGAEGEARYTVGEPLPEGVPFVTLDRDRYGLPEPPPGLIYARVGGDVLLIDPATRMVERRVDPANPEAAEAAAGSG